MDPVWSLTHRRHRLLPTSMLYFDACPDGPPDALVADSNGQAAGSSPEDALLQGFYELVERDAVALWWYNRTRHPAVDLDAFDEPWLAALRGTYRALGRELWALDVTSDLGIPVVAAVSRRTDGADRADGTGRAAEDILLGFGAHPDPGSRCAGPSRSSASSCPPCPARKRPVAGTRRVSPPISPPGGRRRPSSATRICAPIRPRRPPSPGPTRTGAVTICARTSRRWRN